jgi:cell division protease FtsH
VEKNDLSPRGRADESLKTLAETYKADVKLIRERNRRRRLRYLLYLNILVFAYLLRRVIEDRPLEFGLPSPGAESIIWLFPLAMLLIIALAVVGPMLINGRSPAMRFSPEEIDVHFDDVKGLDAVLDEVKRTLQIFLAYKSFREELGGKPRRGVLFEGSPGTGKTHLAKAMAAEAGVPFYFVSATSFQSMWFGMTAFRIRSFFKKLRRAARKEGGAIGFIEEIDAIGANRGGVTGSAPLQSSPARGRGMRVDRFGTTSTDAMVNELLIQMQSFDTQPLGTRMKNSLKTMTNMFLPADHQLKKKPPPYSNVLVIAATNRADVLDPALTRPGRFDRALFFDVPTRSGRRELIDYFLAKRRHAEDMDREDLREELASMTLGYAPAMLEHIIDESLVWALRDGRRELTWRDIMRARLSEEIGLAQPTTYTDRERDLIATHEAGHAVIAYLCAKDHRKLEVLSIIKRRHALGLLAHSDAEERFTKTKSELEATLKITFGGMCAEKLFFGESGTGPSSDLHAATTLACQMIGSFGMGDSYISFEAVQHSAYSEANLVAKVLSTEDTKREVDDMLKRQHQEVLGLLADNRDLVEALRDELLAHEEIMGDEIATVIEKTLAGRNGNYRPANRSDSGMVVSTTDDTSV